MRRLILAVALILIVAGTAAAKDYAADRYDVTIRTMADGSVQVTETIRVTFSGGPFTYMNREISMRRTDGIEVLGASMDGRVMPRGTQPGQFEVRAGNARVAIRWRFPETGDRSHDFRLSYLARGVVQRADAGGLLEWQALPGEHAYRIAASRIIVTGSGLERRPSIRTRRVSDARVERTGQGWIVDAHGIGSNGWIALTTPATLAASAATPKWQVREQRRRALAPRLIQFGAFAGLLSLSVVLLVWRQYPAGPPLDAKSRTVNALPAPRPPAIAAAVLAGGRSSNAHAPGTLFDFAGRGIVTIAEGERGWNGRRRFTLTRGAPTTLAPHESALLDLLFRDAQSVDFSKASSRLARGGRRFRHTVNEELQRLGLTDTQRSGARRRLFAVAIAIAVLSVAATVIVLASDAAPWGLAVPLAMDVAAVVALALGATRAELSDEGFREREGWRGFRGLLKGSIGSMGSIGSGLEPLKYLPYVVAMGLGVALSRHLKRQGADAALPPWFRPLAGSDGPAAFAAFIGATTASSGGGGVTGSGAAGGGSSSAG
jgi:hypothetical protein